MRTCRWLFAVVLVAVCLVGCSSEKPLPKTKAPPPQDSGADKKENQPRFPTPPPKK